MNEIALYKTIIGALITAIGVLATFIKVLYSDLKKNRDEVIALGEEILRNEIKKGAKDELIQKIYNILKKNERTKS